MKKEGKNGKKQKAVENGEENCQKGKVNKKRTNDLKHSKK